MARLFYITIFSFLFLASCTIEEAFDEQMYTPETTQEYPGYFILSGGSYRTKVTYSGDAMSSYFQDGELLGAFALDQDMVPLTGRPINACYKVVVTEETHLETGEKIRILEPNSENDDLRKDGEGIPAYYMFYYPYDSSVQSLDDLKQYEHSVAINQNSREAFQTSDLLWDITSPAQDITGTAEYVWVEMDHAMAQIIIEIDPDNLVPETLPKLIGVKTQADGINLLADGIDAINYTASGNPGNLTAWEFGFSTSRDYMFRIALPAHQTLGTKNAILKFNSYDENLEPVEKAFRLNTAINLQPGRTYYLKAVTNSVHTPHEGEEDSWVLDVKHPVTGKPVGLLCREYIRYQPDHIHDGNFDKADVITGNPTPDGKSKYISSQVWVFYNFYEGTDLPYLDEGTAMRFVYDIRQAFNGAYSENTAKVWPDPHRYGSSSTVAQGLFAADHGHTWVFSPTGDYGMSSEDEVEHYMHGGKVIWNGEGNYIDEFRMPLDPEGNPLQIKNNWAYDHGHIAITPDGKAFVSYAQLVEGSNKDVDGNFVGILNPHYLIDRRIGYTKEANERAYPLVKIGYNQFWMSKSLRATTLNDGTPLICYNKEGEPGANFKGYWEEGSEILEAGYLLPIHKSIDSSKETDFDPFNQLTPEQREENEISLLYNTVALYSGDLLPKSHDSRTYYMMAQKENVEKMMSYCGWCFCAKMMTDGCRIRISNGSAYGEDEWDALVVGKFSHENYNLYAPNISGLNLKSHGGFLGSAEFTSAGEKCSMLLYPQNTETDICIMNYNPWNVFSTSSFAGLYTEINLSDPWNREKNLSRYFAPVRFVMKFKGQADSDPVINVTSTSLAKGLNTKSSAEPVKSRDVYVSLEPVEE